MESHDDRLPGVGDALILVDVQNDFLPGGALPIKRGGEILPTLNTLIARFVERALPVFASRDWHPLAHCSFHAQGGPWPPHCIAGSTGADFAAGLRLPATATIISKATAVDADAYSAFAGTDLDRQLREAGVTRLFVGGLATDYCVLNTVLDAQRAGFDVVLLLDGIRAVNVHPGDGNQAIDQMRQAGVVALAWHQSA